jgi:hypothetical protein
MDKYKIKDLTERLQKENTTELKNKMLFMWIKQEVISLKEYNELIKLILSCTNHQRELLPHFLSNRDNRIYVNVYEDADVTIPWNEYLKIR